MKIKLTQTWARPDGVVFAGQEVDIERDQAEQMIAAGMAVPIRSQKAEAAVEVPAEQMTAGPESGRRATGPKRRVVRPSVKKG